MKTALLFAGQGTQIGSMAIELYQSSSAAKTVFDRVKEIEPSIVELCFCGDQVELSKTKNAQPTLYVVALAHAYDWMECNNMPDFVAGFSLGEIPALVFCGALSIENGLNLVIHRAKLMHECAENREGGMAAVIGLSSCQVQQIVSEVDSLWCANFNSPLQTVIAGDNASIDKAKERVFELKGKLIKLNVSGAFHTPFMQEAADKFLLYLNDVKFEKLHTPLYSNVDAKLYSQKQIKQRLAKQIMSPVKWSEIIVDLNKKGVTQYKEVGAGSVLTGLLSKILV
ncbi:MAG: ACP S-malonyltransferase [Clostridiales bacterium]|jgi:[acyl-carrier-protein] S-malonyltransferase|nr:ACP S-malonyltransferase [Clostridiales bacterium]